MTRRLLKSTLTVSMMTSVSRVLGLLRDIIIARLFGAGVNMDIFIVAFRIPNFFRRLFAEGGFSQAVIPVLTEYKERQGEQAVDILTDQLASSLALLLFVATAMGVLLAPLIIMLFAPGFIGDQQKIVTASQLLRITFPYLFFISLTAFISDILRTYQRFAVPAFTPALLNLSLIGCAIYLSPQLERPIMALAWGVLIGGIGQLLFQLPFLRLIRRLPRPRLSYDHAGVRKIYRLMLPAVFATSIAQIHMLMDTLIASFLVTGSLSWLYFSDRLIQFPLGIFGVALATVMLPNLSREYTSGTMERFSLLLDWGLRWGLLIAIPAALGLTILAGPLLTTLFQYHAFTAYDVEMSRQSLIAYAVGLPGFVLVKLLMPGFFSRQDTKTPVKVGAVFVGVNIALSLLLVWPLKHAGLALATTLSAYIQAAILYFLLYRDRYIRLERGWPQFLLKLLFALAVMSALLILFVAELNVWQSLNAGRRVAFLLCWVGVGAISYFVALRLAGLRFRDMTIGWMV